MWYISIWNVHIIIEFDNKKKSNHRNDWIFLETIMTYLILDNFLRII